MNSAARFPLAGLAILTLLLATAVARAAESLASWNDGPAKAAIVEFVGKVTYQGPPDFVPEP